jgi:membrane dipeptidase
MGEERILINRRAFMTLAAGTAMAGLPRYGFAQAADPLKGMLVVNSLGFPEDTYAPHSPEIADTAAIAANRASGLTAMNATVSSGTSFDDTVKRIREYDAFVKAHPADFVKVLSTADIQRAKAENKIGLIYGFQNAAMIDKPDRVETFFDMGVRIIQLTYNSLNQLGGGSLAPGNPGLTPYGREVVERLNAKRIVIDLSHSGNQICLDAARASKQPICISHTACKTVADSPRNKSDEELRLVAERGGYVGIFFMPYLNPGKAFTSEHVADHIDHAIKVCGEDHVGIGSDHGVNDIGDRAAARAYYGKIVEERRKQGISVAGEDESILPYPDDMIGPNQFRVLASTLLKRGYSTGRLEKVMGANFVRYCRDIWGA